MQSENTNLMIEDPDVATASFDYARRFSGRVGEFFLEIQTKLILRLIEPWPNAKVLDIGGGHGQSAMPLLGLGYKVTVTGSAEVCRERLLTLNLPRMPDFIQCDMLSLPFADKSFDVVVAFRLLPHVHQWKRLISQMCRVARYAVIIDYPDIRSFNYLSKVLFNFKKRIELNTRPFRCFNRKEILNEFRQNGFTNYVLCPEFFLPMVIHRAMNCISCSRFIENVSFQLGLTNMWGSPIILRVSPK